ncbi:MAG: potassium transporter Kup [Myxococcota bacterium]
MDEPPEHHFKQQQGISSNLARLTIGALGVVYGDIGTSPLYAIRECFTPPHGVATSTENVLGILSLITWSLIVVISIKYLGLVMRADNQGEGGILALMALITRARQGYFARYFTIAFGIFGAALLYGDGAITPAISVLSAVEGLHYVTPLFDSYVIPIALVVLVVLFGVQRLGTARVAGIFGPYTLVWFATLGLLGIWHIVQEPAVLDALSPAYAVMFFSEHGMAGVAVLGSVFLVVTGGEALYADMGHFGRRPIRLAWFYVALPGLLLNYLGQGALLLREPGAIENPFFLLAPSWARAPLVLLATGATVIASQAVISGAFSLTRQAVQLGYLPRLAIIHTSSEESGQIYVPIVNWALLLVVIGLVLGFKSSSGLASAYGIAVTTTMVITTALMFSVTTLVWRWNGLVALVIVSLLLVPDTLFFLANLTKLNDGGWLPVLLAAATYILMTTWRRGRELMADRLQQAAMPLNVFLADLATSKPIRVPGTAVYMTSNAEGVPLALLHNIKHNRVLHERVVLLTIQTAENVPVVPGDERVTVTRFEHGFDRIVARYGFMEDPRLADVLLHAREHGLELRAPECTFFLGRETIRIGKRPHMARWRAAMFIWLARNARRADAYFGIPPNRVIELGAQVEL